MTYSIGVSMTYADFIDILFGLRFAPFLNYHWHLMKKIKMLGFMLTFYQIINHKAFCTCYKSEPKHDAKGFQLIFRQTEHPKKF